MRRKREREKVKVTIEQLCEFFDGIKDERINREAVQGLLDDSNRSGLKQLLKNMLAKARKAASEITDLYDKSQAFGAIAKAIAKVL